MIIFILILSWWFIGGLDWINDILENICVIKPLFPEVYTIWEPNFNSYQEWLESLKEHNPDYEEDYMSKYIYIDSKYPNLHEITDEEIINDIQTELFGYEDEM